MRSSGFEPLDTSRAYAAPEIGRASTPAPKGDAFRIVFLGGEIVYGHGVAQEETFVSRLNDAQPTVAGTNLGTAGYGTFQSLTLLEERITDLKPNLVVYGYSRAHPGRNVATGDWIRQRGYAIPPYVTLLRDSTFRREVATDLEMWPMEQNLALVAAVHEMFIVDAYKNRLADALPATMQIVHALERLANANGAQFALMYLDGATKTLRNVAQRQGMFVLPCSSQHGGAPSAADHDRYAQCIAAHLGARGLL